jgi:flagellar motor switch protein FliM
MGNQGKFAMQPLTAEKLQRFFPKREESLKAFSPFFKCVAACIEKELQAYGAAPVKCTAVGDSLRILSAAEQLNNRFTLGAQKERLNFWFEVDRDFELMLCELCLGGNGLVSHETEGSRPQTKFERRLLQAILSSFVHCIASAALKCHAVELVIGEEVDERNDLVESRALQSVQLTLLVNTYAMTGELRLCFSKHELEEVLKVSTLPISCNRVARDTMTECIFELEVYLKPTEYPLEQIISLQRGTVLPLGHSVETPVQVRYEKFHMFEAQLSVRRSAIEITLLPGQAESNPDDAMIVNQVQ